MKRRLIIASAVLAVLSITLCGCSLSEPTPLEPAASESSVLIRDDESSSASSTTSAESITENISENSEETSPTTSTESVSKYPVQNAPSYTVTVTSYEDGKPSGAAFHTYDEHGNVIKIVSKFKNYYYAYEYNDDGTVRVKYDDVFREEYEYENGLEVKCTKYNAQGVEYSVVTHTYDEHGYATSMTNEIYGSADSYTYEHEYDENGFLIKEFVYGDGELKTIATYVPGENGEILSGTVEDANGLFTYEYKYKYDENGREVELHSTYTPNEGVTAEWRVLTEYDEQGRVSREEEYRLDGGEQLVSRKEYDYTV